jgi:hypothetical protein
MAGMDVSSAWPGAIANDGVLPALIRDDGHRRSFARPAAGAGKHRLCPSIQISRWENENMKTTDPAGTLAKAPEPVRAVLAANLPEIPPERHGFFAALEDSYWNTLDQAGVTNDDDGVTYDLGYWKKQWQRRSYWNKRWQREIAESILADGVVRFFVRASDDAFNSDAKEIWRGSQMATEEELGRFSSETIRRILQDGVDATEAST